MQDKLKATLLDLRDTDAEECCGAGSDEGPFQTPAITPFLYFSVIFSVLSCCSLHLIIHKAARPEVSFPECG